MWYTFIDPAVRVGKLIIFEPTHLSREPVFLDASAFERGHPPETKLVQ
jgi:hypothetical protein